MLRALTRLCSATPAWTGSVLGVRLTAASEGSREKQRGEPVLGLGTVTSAGHTPFTRLQSGKPAITMAIPEWGDRLRWWKARGMVLKPVLGRAGTRTWG